jgi:hypothetical protein
LSRRVLWLLAALVGALALVLMATGTGRDAVGFGVFLVMLVVLFGPVPLLLGGVLQLLLRTRELPVWGSGLAALGITLLTSPTVKLPLQIGVLPVLKFAGALIWTTWFLDTGAWCARSLRGVVLARLRRPSPEA